MGFQGRDKTPFIVTFALKGLALREQTLYVGMRVKEGKVGLRFARPHPFDRYS